MLKNSGDSKDSWLYKLMEKRKLSENVQKKLPYVMGKYFCQSNKANKLIPRLLTILTTVGYAFKFTIRMSNEDVFIYFRFAASFCFS